MCNETKADYAQAAIQEISVEERIQNEINFHATRLSELTKLQQLLQKNSEFKEFFKLVRNF